MQRIERPQDIGLGIRAALMGADYAVVEAVLISLKNTRIKKQIESRRIIAAFYKRSRRHRHLDGLSPEQFEAAQRPKKRVD